VLLNLGADYGSGTFGGGGGGSSGGGASLPAQASAPSDPTAGTFAAWWDTDDDQLKVVESDSTDHTLARRQTAVPSTGAVLSWDGDQLEEGSAGCIDAGGVLTCDGFASRATTAPQPQRWLMSAVVCDIDGGSVVFTIPAISTTIGCGNWSTGSAAVLRSSGILLNQSRALNLKAITIMVNQFGANAGWETDEAMEFDVYVCTLDTTPAAADCTVVDTFVLEKDATPDIAYGGSGGINRTALACNATACIQTFDIDGAGRVTSDGDPTWDAGTQDYMMVTYNAGATNFTADAGTTADSLSVTIALDYEN
jgi:hypothetical protein